MLTDLKALINTAAQTNVDRCETHQDEAFAINGEAPGVLAEICARKKARFIHISTDYVFDGTKNSPYTPDDQRAPRSVYGHSKATAETQLQDIMPECCIVRTSWLFGAGGKCFPDTILKLAESRSELDVVGLL